MRALNPVLVAVSTDHFRFHGKITRVRTKELVNRLALTTVLFLAGVAAVFLLIG
jgi:hypothetical protein